MAELFFTCGQIASLAALLYGGWLSITNAGCMEATDAARRAERARQRDAEDRKAWQRYLAWDA